MSVEAISWALNLAPVPADRVGQRSSACRFVLVGLANHAGPDGTGAFPSVATLVRYTGLSERTVRTCLDRLEAEGIISPCDPGIVAARIKRADRRPQGWDLNLSLVRNDLDDASVAVLEHQFPGLGVRLAAAAQPGADGQANGVHSPPPVATSGEAVDNWPDGVQQLHPEPRTGCNRRADGVQLARLRGAAVAPEPYKEPSREPAAPAREAPSAAGAMDGGGPVGGFFAVLGADWRLTGAQRGQAHPRRRHGAERGVDAADTGGLHRGEHQRSAEPVRGAGGAARTRRAAPASHPAAVSATVGAISATSGPGCSGLTVTRRARARAAGLPPQPAAPVLLRRWLAPVPVHLRRRCTAVTECKVTNPAGGHESRRV